MTQYSLFVLKVSLNTNKPNNHLHFNGLFPGGPGLADTGMSLFWILLELRMMEVVVTTGAVGCAKLQSICHHKITGCWFVDEREIGSLPSVIFD